MMIFLLTLILRIKNKAPKSYQPIFGPGIVALLKVNLLRMSKESCSFFEVRLFFWLDL